jgi:hypothetical protein
MESNLDIPRLDTSGTPKVQHAIAKTLRKIELLNQEKDPHFFRKIRVLLVALLGEIGAVFRIVESRKALEQAKLKFGIHMAAEHMSHGRLSGNSILFALNETVDILNKMTSPPKTLIDALEAGKRVWQVVLSRPSLQTQAGFLSREIQKLNPGKSVALPLVFGGHGTALMITCTGFTAEGKKEFRIDHHNTGQGSEKHPHLTTNADVELVQTVVSWDHVPEAFLCEASAVFPQFLLACIIYAKGDAALANLERIYSLLDMFKTRLEPDPKMWGIGQIGGSCSALCLKSLVRLQLSPDELVEFEQLAKTRLLYRALKMLKRGQGDATTRKIALEVACGLEGKAVAEARQQLERSMDIREGRSPFVKRKSSLGNYRKAISILKKGRSSEKLNRKCLEYIAAAAKRKVSSGSMSTWQFEKVIIDACVLWDNNVLTKEQIRILSSLLETLQGSLSYVPSVNQGVVRLLDAYAKRVSSVVRGLQWEREHTL